MSKKILTDLEFGGVSRILGLPNSAAPDQPVTREELNSAIEGLAPKDSARVSTQSNINLSSPGATIDGIAMAATDRVLVRFQTLGYENGIYIWNGAAVAMTRTADASTANELEQAIVAVEEGLDANTNWRQTSVNFTLGTDAITFIPFGAALPPASTTFEGKIRIATQLEVDTGTNANTVVTPQTLTDWAFRIKKFSATIGDGTATQYDVSHNLNSRDAEVQVYRNSTPWDNVLVDVERPDANTARIRFSSPPASNAYRVVVLG